MKEKNNSLVKTKKSNHKKILAVMGLFILFICTVYSYRFVIEEKAYYSYLNIPKENIEEYKSDEVETLNVTQKIKVRDNNLRKLKVQLGFRSKADEVKFKLYNNDKHIKTYELNTFLTHANSDLTLNIDKNLGIKKDDVLTLEYKIDTNVATTYFLNMEAEDLFECEINGEKQINNICIESLYINNKYILFFIVGIIGIVFIFVTIGYILMKTEKLTYEKLFIYTVVPFTMLYSLMIPIGRNADESAHYRRILEICDGKFISEIQNHTTGDLKGSYLDSSYRQLEVNNVTGNYRDFLQTFRVKTTGEKAYNPVFGAAQYSPIAYGPIIIGTKLGLIISNRPMVALMIGKILNTIFALLILYYSIKIIPRYKGILYMLMITPMFLTQITGITADSLIFTLTIFVISYVLKIIEDKKCTSKNLLVLMLTGIILGLSKTGYSAIMIIVLMIPKDIINIKCKYKKLPLFLIILVALILTGVWYYITSTFPTAPDGVPNSLPIKIDLAKENILYPIMITLNTCYVQIESLLMQLIGSHFTDYYKCGTNVYTWLPFLIGMFLVMLKKENMERLRKWDRTMLSLYIIGLVGFLFITFYLVSQYTIALLPEMLGRYFLLPLLVVLILIKNKINDKIELKINENLFYKVIATISWIMILPTVIDVFIYHI